MIDYRLGTDLLVTTIPLALLGTWISERIKPDILIKTDQGNLILDCHFGPISQPTQLAAQMSERAGIVEHGLFLGLATDVIVAKPRGFAILSAIPRVLSRACPEPRRRVEGLSKEGEHNDRD